MLQHTKSITSPIKCLPKWSFKGRTFQQCIREMFCSFHIKQVQYSQIHAYYVWSRVKCFKKKSFVSIVIQFIAEMFFVMCLYVAESVIFYNIYIFSMKYKVHLIDINWTNENNGFLIERNQDCELGNSLQ